MAFIRSPAKSRKQLFLNFKGGTGKTTLSAIYGLRLAELGYRILFVDLDPQGHLTKCVGKNDRHFDKTLYHVLIHNEPIGNVTKRIHGLPAELIPADISLSATELSLSRLHYREWRLLHALAPLKGRYEVVIMDTAPTIGLLNLNGLLAADDLIIPSLPDSLSMYGLKTLFKVLRYVQRDFHYLPENIGILLNRFEPELRHCLDIQRTLAKKCPRHLLRTTIRYCPELAMQPPINRFGRRCSIPRKTDEDIEQLIEEIAPKREDK